MDGDLNVQLRSQYLVYFLNHYLRAGVREDLSGDGHACSVEAARSEKSRNITRFVAGPWALTRTIFLRAHVGDWAK